MGFQSSAAQVFQQFKTAWTHTPIVFENEFYDPTNVEEWIRYTDHTSSARRASLGNNALFRYRGIVAIQTFTKPSIGKGRALELSDYVTNIFRDQKIGATQFYVPYPNVIGTRDGWYQVNVLSPYYRDEE